MFYNPNGKKTKILIEQHAFGSDYVTVATHLSHRGFDPDLHLMEINADSTDMNTPVSRIYELIEHHQDSLCTILLGGVNFLTGEVFPMGDITKFAHDRQIRVIWDLAHAVGNIPIDLHRWGVDGAAWCTYKYLNAGPGSVGGLFVHRAHIQGVYSMEYAPYALLEHEKIKFPIADHLKEESDHCELKYLSGWWGHKRATRFSMAHNYMPGEGASRFMMSTPPALLMGTLLGSLNTLLRCGGMTALRRKSLSLTSFLHSLLDSETDESNVTTFEGQRQFIKDFIEIITPREEDRRGSQVSIRIKEGRGLTALGVFTALGAEGVVSDFRRPVVIRVAPVPAYNSYKDVLNFAIGLRNAIRNALKNFKEGECDVDPTPGKF